MRSPQKVREQEKLVEEKGEKSEGLWSGDGQVDPQRRSQPA